PPNKWADFGTRVHELLESWLQHGTAPDPATAEGRCAIPALSILPPPRSDLAVETECDFYHEGVHYTGRIDLIYGLRSREIVVVHDHKTTGDFKWSKSPAQLVDDPQRVIYSHWA